MLLSFLSPSIHRSLGGLEVALLREPVCDLSNAFFDRFLVGLDGDLGVGGLLVRGRDASKFGNLAGAGLLVEALGVSLLGDLQGDIDEDLNERDRVVAGLAARVGVQLTGHVAVGSVGGDE